MRGTTTLVAVGLSACAFRAGAQLDGGAPDDTTANASDAAALRTSCADILAAVPTSASGTYAIDVDGAGPRAPFVVACDMTDGGWTLVARERPFTPGNQNGPLRFLAADSNNADAIAAGTASGLVGARFAGRYHAVRLRSGATTIQFAAPAGYELFGGATASGVDLSDFTTTDTTLAGWVRDDGGARLCVAATTGTRPGDTSWAIKPRKDDHTGCGCNDAGWNGRGAFYGGSTDQTACLSWGGGWAGVKDVGIQKGGLAPTVETTIWIR